MSYESIIGVAKRHGIDLAAYKKYWEEHGKFSDEQQVKLDGVFIEAWRTDLPLGLAEIEDMVEEHRETGETVCRDHPPLSDLGKQLIRLFAADQARAVIGRVYGVGLGFYNCCSPVIGPLDGTVTDPIEQILSQGPEKEHC